MQMMGAVYQAAALSKAFKVKPFVVRDAAKENTCFCGAVAKKQERTIEEPSIGRRSCVILPFIETQKLFCPPQNVARCEKPSHGSGLLQPRTLR